MSSEKRVLLADIGGTNARFALADTSAASPLLDDSVRGFAVADFPSLADAAAHYLSEIAADNSAIEVRHGVFAVAGRVDGTAHRGHVRGHPGRGLVVHNAHGLERMALVLAQPRLDPRGIDAAPPIAWNELGRQGQALGQFLPEGREMAGLDHQDGVAGRERVDQCCLPGPGAGRGVDHHRTRGLEDRPQTGQHLLGQFAQ